LYAFAALEAFSATALNSLPVQALAVDMSEIVPAPAVASNASDDGFGIVTFSHNQKIAVARREVEVDEFSFLTAGSRSSGAATSPLA
jgi:hypothetical protein